MKKFIIWLRSNFLWIVPVLLFLILLFSLFDRNFYIGGDNVMPLNVKNTILKSIYTWEEENRGFSFFRYTLLYWQIPFYVLSLFNIPADIQIKIYILLIPAVGFIFTYLLYQFLFINTKYGKKELGVVAASVFTLSAAALLILPTTIFLAALPLCNYFAIKYIDTRKYIFAIVFSYVISLAYFAHLPQAKYVIIFSVEFFFILFLYKELKQKNIMYILTSLILLGILTSLLTAPLLIPFFFDSFRKGGIYNYFSTTFTNYNGDADLNSAALPFISRFFNANLVNTTSSLGIFLGGKLFSLWSFILWILACIPLFISKTKKDKTIVYVLMTALVIFIFIAKGSNPPFGEIYKYLLFHVFIFKVFRTTSIAIIGGMLFFSMLVAISFYSIIKKWFSVFYLFIFLHVIVFHPVYLGTRLISVEKKEFSQKGFTIPQEYYDMGRKLDAILEDTKILSLPLDEGYSYKDWQGYMGVSPMSWITRKAFIHGQVAGYTGFKDNLVLQRLNTQESCYYTAINNIGYILNEKDSRIPYRIAYFNFPSTTIFEDAYFKLDKVKPSCVLPHIYSANMVYFQGEKNHITDISQLNKDKKDIVMSLDDNKGRKKLGTFSQIIVEATPRELQDLDKNIFVELPTKSPFSFLTYQFTIPEAGMYQMLGDIDQTEKKQTTNFSKGEHTIQLPLSKGENLIDYDTSITHDMVFTQSLSKWEKDTIYLLTLNYTVDYSSTLSLDIEERIRTYNGRLSPDDLNSTLLLKNIHQSYPGTYIYQVLLRSDINTLSAIATLSQREGLAHINTYSIQKIIVPKLFFLYGEELKKPIPDLHVHKVNATKYIVNVDKANFDYNLVLSESFNEGWKAYIANCTHCGIWDTWLRPSLPEENHFVANGFSNGWQIFPKDSAMKKKYTIIIEYWPQRLFYFGVIISVLTLIFLSLTYISMSIQKKTKNL